MTAPNTVWPCERCGGRLNVLASAPRFPHGPRRVGLFVYRPRECSACGWRVVTVEARLADMAEATETLVSQAGLDGSSDGLPQD